MAEWINSCGVYIQLLWYVNDKMFANAIVWGLILQTVREFMIEIWQTLSPV